jgi:cytochrome c551/c552
VTRSMYEGLGYTPNGVQSAATKPVSGDRIVTSLERLDAIQDHGTKKGYEAGCRGSHCPGRDVVGMSCSQASIRYAGDMGYRRRVDAGVSAEQIWVEDQAANVVMPKATRATRQAEQVWDGEQLTVEDSVAVYEADEDFEADEAAEKRPVIVGLAHVAGGPKWVVRRAWVAVSPLGRVHGPFETQDAAMAVVVDAFAPATVAKPKIKPRPAGKQTRRRITDEDRATFRALHGEGLSTGKIAKQTTRAVSVVARELGLMGLASNGHKFGKRA